MNDFQQTISSEISFSGIGIHTGKKANITLKPAECSSGIKFVRVDHPDNPSVSADIDYVVDVSRGTTLQNGKAKVQTVEHLLAAAYGLGIDNLIVQIDKDELPVGDGSANDYTSVFLKAGLKKQDKKRKYWTPSEIIYYRNDKTELVVIPSDKFSISATIYYGDDVLGSQFLKMDITGDNFINGISTARTYCFEKEIKSLLENGLGKGGTYENTIIIGETGITNTKLRFKDEFVRHKILDLLGDLFLLGVRLKANVIAIRSGHASNIELTKKLKKDYLADRQKGTGTVPCGGNPCVMDIEQILKILPHRYPFLLVDKITMDSSWKFATGYKNITIDEPFFKGHYPANPIFPPSLIIEFMAQSSAVMLLANPEFQEKLAYFIVIEKAEFFHDVQPLDVLKSRVELVRARAKGGKVRGTSYVGDKKVAEAEFMFSLVDK